MEEWTAKGWEYFGKLHYGCLFIIKIEVLNADKSKSLVRLKLSNAYI